MSRAGFPARSTASPDSTVGVGGRAIWGAVELRVIGELRADPRLPPRLAS
ncbi:MAG: hypothetical protein WKF58_07085 [Ilumatobacteraceae bacterium]